MSAMINYVLIVFLILAEILALLDLMRLRLLRRFLLQTAVVCLAVLVLYLTVGFPIPSDRRAFGGGYSAELAIVLMFVGVILGMAARYLFRLRQSFSWLDFVRPLVISPIVLLPLIGTLQDGGIEAVQLACLVILAFQNGFFWQQVLKDARPTTA